MKEKNKIKSSLQKYLQWPLVLSVFVLCANAAITMVSLQAGIAMAIFSALYLICAGVLFFYGKRKLTGGLVSFATGYSWSQKKLLDSMELPYGIADMDGRLLWVNQALAAVIKE